ncbi:MAG: hypothetical protein ACK4FP_05110 [Azonexus sp.]
MDRFDSAGTAGRIRLVDALGNDIVIVTLRYPAGVTTENGITLWLTEYAQVAQTAEVAKAIAENGTGAWVADFTTGLVTDDPVPDLPLPAIRLYAGSFVRLSANIACY